MTLLCVESCITDSIYLCVRFHAESKKKTSWAVLWSKLLPSSGRFILVCNNLFLTHSLVVLPFQLTAYRGRFHRWAEYQSVIGRRLWAQKVPQVWTVYCENLVSLKRFSVCSNCCMLILKDSTSHLPNLIIFMLLWDKQRVALSHWDSPAIIDKQ